MYCSTKEVNERPVSAPCGSTGLLYGIENHRWTRELPCSRPHRFPPAVTMSLSSLGPGVSTYFRIFTQDFVRQAYNARALLVFPARGSCCACCCSCCCCLNIVLRPGTFPSSGGAGPCLSCGERASKTCTSSGEERLMDVGNTTPVTATHTTVARELYTLMSWVTAI